jgi:hypothetical protein
MFSFSSYLNEAANEDKLTHLEHAEDHPINAGEEGFKHAFNTLHGTHLALQGKKSSVSLSTKYDGSPSVIFGHHPESGRFFVASKSVFNKDPKLNYTESDIQKNHGHAPGLVSKLTSALHHLQKVTPNRGVYQGDIMHSGVKSKTNPHGDLESSAGSVHFKPNTITYSAKNGTPEAAKAKAAKIGVAVHTAYHGNKLEDMKAHYNADISHFNKHPDVHMIDTSFKPSSAHYTPDAQKTFEGHMKKAVEANNKLKSYSHIEGGNESHKEHLKTYINQTVRTNSAPSVAGYKAHVTNKLQKEVDKVKTDKAKAAKTETLNKATDHIDNHKEEFKTTLDIHKHLQNAKNVLGHTLSGADYAFHHSYKGKSVKPEGHVAVLNNRPSKIVDRKEFSANNFERSA